jgi:TolB-like protein/Tfp pilus assembly protein PilF
MKLVPWSVPPALTEALLDRYVVERELGRGGMATVYLARDLKHDRFVALKVLHPELAQALGPERFQREIKLSSGLQHPHILSVHDSGETGGCLWFTMPYVAGESLRDRLTRERQLPLDDAIRITREAAQALDYAHKHGVIHRDIKPENLLLTEDGSTLVADFGIARSQDGAELLTQTGMSVGTPAYMSPEQAAGDRSTDSRTDIYSLGCVLYELLAGEPPFTGLSPQAILAKRVMTEVPPLRAVRRSAPQALEAVVTRALALAPADRFRTAGEFAQALTPETWAGVVPTNTLTRGTFGRRRPWRVAAGTLLALALLGAGVITGLRLHRGSVNGEPMLAILPFENLGDPEDQYFADGLTEELTSRLAGLGSLGVISRTSTMQYRGTTKSLRQIGLELGANYILEGSVRFDRQADGSGRIRVTPQLIQVTNDRHVWSDHYDAELANVFEMQGSIAERVARSLNVTLGQRQKSALTTRPTDSLRAYDYFLRGNEALNALDKVWMAGAGPLNQAVEMYQKAVEVDSQFALAYAKLSLAQLALYESGVDPSRKRLQEATEALNEARRLDPELPDVHVALGSYYRSRSDFDRARKEFGLALRLEPQSSEVLAFIADLHQRRGRFDSSAVFYRRAATLDPRSVGFALAAAWSLIVLQDYAEAQHHVQRAIKIAPDAIGPWFVNALLELDWHADSAEAYRQLRDAVVRLGVTQTAPQIPLPALAHFSGDSTLAPAFDQLTARDFGSDTAYYYLWKAEWNYLRRRRGLMRTYSDSVRALVELQARRNQKNPEWPYRLSLAYAGLGLQSDAIREAERALALSAQAADLSMRPADHLFHLAELHRRFGDQDKAVSYLERLLAVPSQYSKNFLRSWPGASELQRNSRFQRLLQP